MPMTVVYATVNGSLVQENRGGVVTRYVSDTQGNVIQSRSGSGTLLHSNEYWPFGEVKSFVGPCHTDQSPWRFASDRTRTPDLSSYELCLN
jgi:hypothetical protein